MFRRVKVINLFLFLKDILKLMTFTDYLSSKCVKFRRCGFRGDPILFAVEQTGSFLLLRFDWLVKQIRFALSIIAVVVTSKVAEYLRYLFASHFLTDDRYHN